MDAGGFHCMVTPSSSISMTSGDDSCEQHAGTQVAGNRHRKLSSLGLRTSGRKDWIWLAVHVEPKYVYTALWSRARWHSEMGSQLPRQLVGCSLHTLGQSKKNNDGSTRRSDAWIGMPVQWKPKGNKTCQEKANYSRGLAVISLDAPSFQASD